MSSPNHNMTTTSADDNIRTEDSDNEEVLHPSAHRRARIQARRRAARETITRWQANRTLQLERRRASERRVEPLPLEFDATHNVNGRYMTEADRNSLAQAVRTTQATAARVYSARASTNEIRDPIYRRMDNVINRAFAMVNEQMQDLVDVVNQHIGLVAPPPSDSNPSPVMTEGELREDQPPSPVQDNPAQVNPGPVTSTSDPLPEDIDVTQVS
ncbi:hypothetical protein MJO29_014771 [Puccinia striiformis f. sp. tritici]|uniref:Uncharacterized protein n=1 Tax=Puccinia striiformis TaxID=27350 RepID=A0A2S4UE12_9BASI|nr:hypothetical protein Pst134EB_021740 [Puccinia striiformis f. sp. tritici]KAH9458224.1 hypothetical protein Pst134EB_010522 [Puccinia striiformis f. sp. tritici]KAI7937456.1 hypothetical protein MJO29_014771 [Puccinia striiformis f. sp. tritici]POV95563.1 hypothetical protein PSHT_15605 [Puccinia striiformis]